MKKSFLLLSILLLSFSLFAQQRPQNVILLIGDGMGPGQERVLQLLTGGNANLSSKNFTHEGMATTYSRNDSITDSAAGGSALSTGVKTNNHFVACNPDGKPNETLLEWAEKKGMSTGLVVTCGITNATPAAFYAHVTDRKENEKIAKYLTASGVDYAVGGGLHYFLPQNRRDKQNLVDSLVHKGYVVVIDSTGWGKNVSDKLNYCQGRTITFIDDKHPGAADKRNNLLEEGVRKGLQKLSKEKNGFFMMVEGSQIDWAAHVNNMDYLAKELLDFDKAVGAALEFAKNNPNTLVIVTADHDTGGLNFKNEIKEQKLSVKKIKKATSWKTLNHSNAPVNVHAYGPGSELFQGKMDNTDIPKKIRNLME